MFVYPFLYANDYYRSIYRITIDRANRRLILFRDNQVFKTYPVAVGKGATPTPKGTFRIINKQINPGGPYGARWLGLSTRGVGIHGTNNPTSIGGPVSHGCIRMFNKDVIELSSLVPLGTVVNIV